MGFEIWKFPLQLHLTLRTTAAVWVQKMYLSQICVGMEIPLFCFSFCQHGEYIAAWHYCDLNNISCHWNDFTTIKILLVSAVLPCNFMMNSFKNITKLAGKTHFQSYLVSNDSGWGWFFLFRKVSFLTLSLKKSQ